MDIPLLKVTEHASLDDPEADSGKPVIVVIGRQHPGETHSSFIIHGFLNYLLAKTNLAA